MNNLKKKNIFIKKYKYNLKFIFNIIISLILYLLDILSNNILYKIKNNIINYFYYIIYIPLIYSKNIFTNINNNFYTIKKLLLINQNLNKKIELNDIKYNLLKKYKKENIELKNILKINVYKKYKYIFSEIIYYNFLFSKLIINKGKNDGINIGQPVLNSSGIIGYISNINNNNSYVTLLYNNKSVIPVKILRNNIKFIVKGSGINRLLICKNFNILKLNNINDIIENDVLLSSGLDNMYPKDYPIGYISKINKKDKYYIDIEIKTFFNIDNTNYLVILSNKNIE